MDEAYNREERKVMTLEKAVRSLVRDIALFIEQLQVGRNNSHLGPASTKYVSNVADGPKCGQSGGRKNFSYTFFFFEVKKMIYFL